MEFNLTEEQELLQESTRELLENESPLDEARASFEKAWHEVCRAFDREKS